MLFPNIKFDLLKVQFLVMILLLVLLELFWLLICFDCFGVFFRGEVGRGVWFVLGLGFVWFLFCCCYCFWGGGLRCGFFWFDLLFCLWGLFWFFLFCFLVFSRICSGVTLCTFYFLPSLVTALQGIGGPLWLPQSLLFLRYNKRRLLTVHHYLPPGSWAI